MDGGQILILALPLLALWFLVMRPAQRKQRAALELRSSLRPGQEVVTTAGVIGTVTQVDGGEVLVSVAPGVELRMVKAAIGQVRSAPDDEDPGDPEAASTDEPGNESSDDSPEGGTARPD